MRHIHRSVRTTGIQTQKLLFLVVPLLFVSCIGENAPDTGRVEFVNSSTADLLVVRGAGDDLGPILDRATTHITTTPDRTRTFQFEYTERDGRYCEPPLISYWILESRDQVVFDGEITSLDEAAFLVRDRVGPDLCWGSKRSNVYDVGE